MGAQTDIRLREVSERDFTETLHTLEVSASILCPPTFVYHKREGLCKFYKKEAPSVHCSGINVNNKCLIEVLPDTYCEKPWVQDGNVCAMTVYAPGLYTWVMDFHCFGSADYCEEVYNKNLQ